MTNLPRSVVLLNLPVGSRSHDMRFISPCEYRRRKKMMLGCAIFSRITQPTLNSYMSFMHFAAESRNAAYSWLCNNLVRPLHSLPPTSPFPFFISPHQVATPLLFFGGEVACAVSFWVMRTQIRERSRLREHCYCLSV